MDEINIAVQRLKAGYTASNGVFIAPGAVVIGDVILKEDVSIWYNAVLRGDLNQIIVGSKTNIQDGSIVHVTYKNNCPVIIGENVTIGHGVTVHGCTIGNNCLIGIGSIILDGAVIGDNSIVAAGSLVPPDKEYPAYSFIMGHPAKFVRKVTQKDLELINMSFQRYISYKNMYIENKGF